VQLARTEWTAQSDRRVRLGPQVLLALLVPQVPLVPQVQLAPRERMELSGRREPKDLSV
jgi:hypothetical protein